MAKKCDIRNIELMLVERGIEYSYLIGGSHIAFKRQDGTEFIVGPKLGKDEDGYSIHCTCYSARDAMHEIFGD